MENTYLQNIINELNTVFDGVNVYLIESTPISETKLKGNGWIADKYSDAHYDFEISIDPEREWNLKYNDEHAKLAKILVDELLTSFAPELLTPRLQSPSPDL